MVSCSQCRKDVEEKKAVKLMINGEQHYFHFHHVKSLTSRLLSGVVLNKAFAELIAIGTGIGGIMYTLLGVAHRALIMDTFSVVAALAALLAGVSHLRYLKEHDYARRAILFAIIGVLMLIVAFVWHFGFRLNIV